MEEKLLLCCRSCETYIPLRHPDAAGWMTSHADGCSVWQEVERKKAQTGQLHVPNLGLDPSVGCVSEGYSVTFLAFQTREDHLFRAACAPEGYSCAVGLLEELAFSVGTGAE
jgi:hypothetical protein